MIVSGKTTMKELAEMLDVPVDRLIDTMTALLEEFEDE